MKVRSIAFAKPFRPMLARPVLALGVTTLLASALWLVVPAAQSQDAQVGEPGDAAAAARHQQMIQTYCIGCHNDKARTGDMSLEGRNLAEAAANPDLWEKVLRKLNGGLMPPRGMPRPPQETLDAFTDWVELTLDDAALAKADPGRAPVHRLNRTEYGNAIRDLLAVTIDPAEYLPPDTESDGFDNIADALRVSPTLIDQYLTASGKIAELAVGDMDIKPLSSMIQVPPDLAQGEHIPGLPLGTRGGTKVMYNFPLDAEYDFHVSLFENIIGYVTGLEYPHTLEISIDGERVFSAPVGGEEDNLMSDTNIGVTKDTLAERLQARIPVKAGRREVVVTFVRRDSAESDEPLEPHTWDHDLQNMNGIPIIDHFQITGPLNATGPGNTPSRERIFSCHPASESEETPCAREILGRLARMAYRRPVESADLSGLMGIYQIGRDQGGFEKGIEAALRLMLTDPKFLFRGEPNPKAAPGSVYELGDIELASRLSFFLWSSIPDDQLLTVAEEGRLSDPEILKIEVKRMLDDPKASALTDNFAGQWLLLRNLQSQTRDPMVFPNFDDNLRKAMRRETELLFANIMRENRPVTELLDADYTFLNERLAKHYGIEGVYGSHFRKVHLDDVNRRGLLGQGSILTVTSESNRTSPVKRGKWVLENLIGTPAPSPPPNVPALTENPESGKGATTLRARMELHRKNPVCASCHSFLDPMGFALENFDATGAWRTMEPGGPVNAAGQLADGTEVTGPVELRAALLRRPENFVNTFTAKLLVYALGRGLETQDNAVVRTVTRGAAPEYRFDDIVLGIVNSVPFRMRKVQEARDVAGGAE